MGYVRPYQEGDAEELEPRLRDADRAEINAVTEKYPLEVLREGGELSSPSCTIIGNTGNVVGMFGIVSEGDFGRVWLLGSDELVTGVLSRQFIRECRRYLQVLGKPYREMGNVIDERNVIHMKWLRWLGFTFIRRIEKYGVEERPFMEFKKSCANQ